MLVRLLFSIGAIFASYSLVTPASGKRFFYLESYTNCHEKNRNSYSIFIQDVSIGMRTPEVSEYNGTVVIQKDFGQLKLLVMASKCKTSAGHECEGLMNVPLNDFCRTVTEKNQFWSAFAQNMEPPFTCPIRKGNYRTTHVTIPIELVEKLMEPNIHYKLEQSVIERNQEVGCFRMIGRVMSLKSKKRKTAKSIRS